MKEIIENGIWFVYDGECPLCTSTVLAFRIKEEYGELNVLNARDSADHWLIQEITAKNYDLDEGMVIYNGERIYHGKDALRFMAKFGDNRGVLNRIRLSLSWSDGLARISYPVLRCGRNFLLRLKGVKQIENLGRDRD